MMSFRSSIAERHLQQKALGAQTGGKQCDPTAARRGKLGCVLAVPKSLKEIMFMAQSADGAAEPALL